MKTNRQRHIEINDELKQMRQRRRELLEERRSLSGTLRRSSEIWVDPIFSIIKNNPGVSRREIFIKLSDPHVTFGDLSNCLTTLRRNGKIVNRGTRRDSRWYDKESIR